MDTQILVHIDSSAIYSMASGTLNPVTLLKSPWGKVATVVSPCSLEDVMSEQLALEIDTKQQEQIETAIIEEQRFFDEIKSRYKATIFLHNFQLNNFNIFSNA